MFYLTNTTKEIYYTLQSDLPGTKYSSKKNIWRADSKYQVVQIFSASLYMTENL